MKFIKEYSGKLINEVGKKYNYKTLFKMRKFYLVFEKFPTMSRQLTWSHYVELLKYDDINIINYYINITIKYNLSIRELRSRIKNKEYERLDDKTKEKLAHKEEFVVGDFIKNPILIKNSYRYEEVSEKLLKQLILEDLDNFLTELGEGFTYIKNEYKIKIGNTYNYIDLLLYNINYNSYIVVELKVTEMRKEYVGQIEVYMNYIDKNLKTINQDKTIGIIICRSQNQFVMEYCSDKRIYEVYYQLC